MFSGLASITNLFKFLVVTSVLIFIVYKYISLSSEIETLTELNESLLIANTAYESANEAQVLTIEELRLHIEHQDKIALERSAVEQQVVKETQMAKQDLTDVVKEFEDEDDHNYINDLVPADIIRVLNEAAQSDYKDHRSQRISASVATAALHDPIVHWDYEQRLNRIHF